MLFCKRSNGFRPLSSLLFALSEGLLLRRGMGFSPFSDGMSQASIGKFYCFNSLCWTFSIGKKWQEKIPPPLIQIFWAERLFGVLGMDIITVNSQKIWLAARKWLELNKFSSVLFVNTTQLLQQSGPIYREFMKSKPIGRAEQPDRPILKLHSEKYWFVTQNLKMFTSVVHWYCFPQTPMGSVQAWSNLFWKRKSIVQRCYLDYFAQNLHVIEKSKYFS